MVLITCHSTRAFSNTCRRSTYSSTELGQLFYFFLLFVVASLSNKSWWVKGKKEKENKFECVTTENRKKRVLYSLGTIPFHIFL